MILQLYNGERLAIKISGSSIGLRVESVTLNLHDMRDLLNMDAGELREFIGTLCTRFVPAQANEKHGCHGGENSTLPQRQWVGLTDEEIYALCSDFHNWSEWDGGRFQKKWLDLGREIEANLKEKNT